MQVAAATGDMQAANARLSSDNSTLQQQLQDLEKRAAQLARDNRHLPQQQPVLQQVRACMSGVTCEREWWFIMQDPPHVAVVACTGIRR